MHYSTLFKSLLVATAAAPWLAAAAEGSDVLDLTQSNFESTINEEALILVEFFAPWCGHCKSLAPHYEESATALKEKKIKLAKVDCVDQADLCQQHGISGYPTLKVYRNGTPTDYGGPRQADGIIGYMTKQALPAVTEVTNENHEEFQKADKVVAIAYLSSSTEAVAPVFSAVAEKLRDEYLFGLTTDEAAIAAAKVTPPALVLYKKFDDGRADLEFTETVTEETLGSFIKENAMPLMDEISGDNYGTYAQTGLPLAYLFVDPKDPKKEEYIKELSPIAKANKGIVNFVWIDAEKFVDHAKSLTLEPTWPAFVIQDVTKQLKYPLDQATEVDAKSVEHFVNQYNAGRLEPKLKSEPVKEQTEAVYNLVGTEFESVVYDEDKDVFVEFYAPWCGHCKRLAPTWESLAEKYADIKDKIVIAKMDATENDIPPSAPFTVAGFPTIKFKPAGTRSFLDYEGDRSLESLVEFIEQSAKNSLVLPEKKVKEAAASETGSAGIPAHTADVHDEL